jgi:hypothetical protein
LRERITVPPDDAAGAALDQPSVFAAEQLVVIPTRTFPEVAAFDALANQAPGAVSKRLGDIAVDVYQMIHHRVLRAVERIVKGGEITLEARQIPPAGGPEVRIDVVGEDAVKKLPTLGVHGQPVKIDDLHDRQNIVVGQIVVAHDSSFLLGQRASPPGGAIRRYCT